MHVHRPVVALLLMTTALALTAGMVIGAEAVPAAAEGQSAQVSPTTLSLEEAITLALQYNPQVGAAEQGVRVAEGRYTQAASLLLPRLEVNAVRDTPVDLPPFSFRSADTTWETQFSFSQPLYTGGSIQKSVRAARQVMDGTVRTYRRTQQEIAFAVRQTYYQVLTADQQVKVAREVVGSAREHLRVARLRYDAGVAPQFDVLSAEARVARVEQALIAAQTDLSISRAALSTVVGVPIAESTQLITPRPAEVAETVPEALRTEALSKRPDLLAVQATVSASAALVDVARGARRPRVSAAATYTLRQKTTISGDAFGVPGAEFVVSQNSGDIVLVTSWSLFNGGQVTGEIRTAEAQLRQAEKYLESAQLQVELEVKSAYLLVEAAKAQVAAAQKEVDQAQEAHRIATLRYQEGVGTSVEILDAEAGLEGAKTRLNGAVYDLNLAVAKLDLAVGRDWTESAPPPSTAEATE